MKIKILVSMAGRNADGKVIAYAGGGIYDLPNREAKEYIKLGRAELIKEEPRQKPLTVQEIKKTKRRPVTRKK